MSKVEELLAEVRKSSGRIEAVEKTVTEMGKARGDATDVLRKALLDGRGNAVVGWGNGADRVMNLTGHQKAIGMGEYLRAVHAVAVGKGVDQADKALEKMGARAIHKVALAEGSGFTGGYTIPQQFHAELLRLVAEESFAEQRCFKLPMTSRTLLVPRLDQKTTPVFGSSAFFGGVAATWTPESTAIPESDPTFEQSELVARDLAFHTIASNQLLADNVVALDTLLTTLFKEAMAWFKDFYVLRGTGAAQPLGVLTNPTFLDTVTGNVENPTGGPALVVKPTVSGTFTFQVLARMLSRLLVNSWKDAVWLFHPSAIPDLVTLADSANGRVVWLNQAPPTEAGGSASIKIPATLFGIPVLFTEKLPRQGATAANDGYVSLVDFSKYLLGDRMQLQIETSPHVRFLTNQMVWRIIARWDGQPWPSKPIPIGPDGFVMSPFVLLGGAQDV